MRLTCLGRGGRAGYRLLPGMGMDGDAAVNRSFTVGGLDTKKATSKEAAFSKT